MKKLLALTLAALLIFAMIGCNKQNEDATEEEKEELATENVYENFTYGVNKDGELEITGYLNTSTTPVNVTIPAEIDGRRIVGIGDSAFSTKLNIASVTFPETITYIGEYAFTNCTSLTAINFPSKLTTIGEGAFQNCRSLVSVAFPASLLSIGTGAFMDCVLLQNFTLPEGLLTIEDGAFYGCWSLTKVTIPTTVLDLGDSAFYRCTSLYEVNLLGDKKTDAADDAILAIINALIADSGINFATLDEEVNGTTIEEILNNKGYYLAGVTDRGAKFIWDKNNDKVYGAMTAADEALLANINQSLIGDESSALAIMIQAMQKKGFDPDQLNASVASDKFVWDAEKNAFTTVYTGKSAFDNCTANTIISVTEGSIFADYAKNAGWITVTPADAPEGAKIFSNNKLAFFYPEDWTIWVSPNGVMIENDDFTGLIITSQENDHEEGSDHTLWDESVFGTMEDYWRSIIDDESIQITDMAILQATNANNLQYTKISCTITDEDGPSYSVIYLISIENTIYQLIYAEQSGNYYTAIENSFVSLG